MKTIIVQNLPSVRAVPVFIDTLQTVISGLRSSASRISSRLWLPTFCTHSYNGISLSHSAVCLRRVLGVAIRDRDDIASIPLQRPYIFHFKTIHKMYFKRFLIFNPLNSELNPICYLLALLGAHHFLNVSRIRVKLLTLKPLMSYTYGAPILDVSRSHTTTQHSR